MGRKKSNKNNIKGVFSVFFSSVKYYFLYAEECLKYLLFPVLGQLFGFIAIFTVTYFFTMNKDSIKGLSPVFTSDNNLFLLLCVVLIPCFILFSAAVYKYLIALSSLNIFFYTVAGKQKKKKTDISEYDCVVKRRFFKYVVVLTGVTLILIIPPLCFLSPVSAFFLCLIFQIFALEPDSSVFDIPARSIELVKDNLLNTLIMVFLCGFTTYIFFPTVFVWLANKISLCSVLTSFSENFIKLLPLDEINKYADIFNFQINPVDISKNIPGILISFLVVGFSLPFRAACFTGLYKMYDSEKIKEFSKESEEIIKRATKRKN